MAAIVGVGVGVGVGAAVGVGVVPVSIVDLTVVVVGPSGTPFEQLAAAQTVASVVMTASVRARSWSMVVIAT
ncbi:MAG: hypothetical protein ABJA98_28045 [Acidobacteriota bacterium]